MNMIMLHRSASCRPLRRVVAACVLAGVTGIAEAHLAGQGRVSADLHVSVTVVRRCTINTGEYTPSRDSTPTDKVAVTCVRGTTPRHTVAVPSTTGSTEPREPVESRNGGRRIPWW